MASVLDWVPGFLIATVAISLAYRTRHWHRRLPPGPKPSWNPLVGNLKQIRALHEPWYTWAGTELKQKYGDIVQLSVTGQRLVVLNSLKAISELFGREIYSDRPHFTMAGDIMGGANMTVLSPYGPYWKTHRRLYQQTIGNKDLFKTISHICDEESRGLAMRLLLGAGNPLEEVQLTIAKWILRIAYGMEVKSLDDDFVRSTEANGLALSTAFRAGSCWVDSLPLLRFVPSWFPGAGWKTYGREVRKRVDRMIKEPYENLEQQLAAGQDVPKSIVSRMIKEGLADRYAQMNCAGNMYGAGFHSSVSFFTQFIALMLLHPEVQKKAQDEIDSVVGTARLPNIDDKDSLPYMDAVIQEVFRYEVVSPLAAPHRVSADDEYQGLFIPKGTTVLSNLWAVTQDAVEYPEPDKFNPDRFFNLPVGSSGPLDPRAYSFGVGRRVCPGRPVADVLIFLITTRLLATFHIAQPLDENDKEYLPEVTLSRFNVKKNGGVPDFPVRMVPRSERALSELLAFDT